MSFFTFLSYQVVRNYYFLSTHALTTSSSSSGQKSFIPENHTTQNIIIIATSIHPPPPHRAIHHHFLSPLSFSLLTFSDPPEPCTAKLFSPPLHQIPATQSVYLQSYIIFIYVRLGCLPKICYGLFFKLTRICIIFR